jgi:nitroimidazol reductase NimA-like FMN-containing flavoprotein (pyridoxamine 5'-phosphate oxidase superfamily)
MAGFRMSEEEIWGFVTNSHTGIMTTLRRDGMPISLPLWFAVIDRTIYVHTRGKKVARLANDSRASFLVESGDFWAELKAVHFTGHADQINPDAELLTAIEAETSRKYEAFRLPPDEMPDAAAAHYASRMRWVRFTPDERVLAWSNAKLLGRP